MNNNGVFLIVLAVFWAGSSSSISGVYGQWDPENSESCTDCAQNADGMLNCVEKHCGPDYAYCLSTPSFDGASSLPGCCDMNDSDCAEYATRVDDCLADCLPKCVNKKVNDYLECTAYTSTIRSASGCDLNDCYAGIALDRDWANDDDLKNTDKFFKKLTDNISDMSSYDQQGICDGAESKATAVCKIGETCCEPCVKELSKVMDCVVNDMILPYKLSSYSSDDDCEVQCNKLTRSLETDNTNTTAEDTTTESLTGNAEQDAAISAKSKEALKPCFNQMNLQIVLGNVTKAGDELVNCMVNESVKVLVTDDSTAKDTTATTTAASPAATIVVKASIISVLVVAAATSVIALV